MSAASGLIEFGFCDTMIPLSDIASIGPEHKDAKGVVLRDVRLKAGANRTAYAQDMSQLLHRPLQLIPAAAGTFVVRVWIDNGVGEASRTMVIAWANCVDGEVRPVTPQGVETDLPNGTTYVMMADGTVQSVGQWADVVWFDNLDEFIAHEVEHRAENLR